MNILADVSTWFISFSVEGITPAGLNWLGKIIQALIEGVGIFALGVMLFTIVLKTIVLPLDAYSRVKSKKQALIMEEMRPQMEKLQKQYANDRQMYSQKVMELQKKSGYSMLSACIPMIVSLVIFIFVFQAFSTYSQYANLTMYNNMVNAYSESVQEYVFDQTDNPDGFLLKDIDPSTGEEAYLVDFGAFSNYPGAPELPAAAAEGASLSEQQTAQSERMTVVLDFVKVNARAAAADYYRENDKPSKFLWISNIWYPDSMLNKAVPKFSDFSSSVSRAIGSGIPSTYAQSYDEITHDLSKEKGTYNGYFVLIVLAIGSMFLQQFIMMRSQKSVNELGSVDGSGKRTNRWMMILMPIIFGIFSFFYSAAFSIYMITNTVYSLITTLIINKIVAVRFAKREENAEIDKLKKRAAPERKKLK